jgi:hypothetical protein
MSAHLVSRKDWEVVDCRTLKGDDTAPVFEDAGETALVA